MIAPLPAVVIIVGLLLVASLASTSRAALDRVTTSRAGRLAEEERSGASTLLSLVEDGPRVWSTLTLLVVLPMLAAAGLAQELLSRTFAPAVAVLLTTGAVGLAAYALVSVIPRTVATRRPDDVACRLAGVTRLAVAVLQPVTLPLTWIASKLLPGADDAAEGLLTEEAIRDLIDEAEGQGVEPAERQMLHSIFELSDTLVREIMVPRPDVVMVSDGLPLASVVEVILRNGTSRVPVHRGDDRDDVVGLLYAKDVLQRIHTAGGEGGPWTDLVREPYVVPELKSVDGLLRELQAEQVHLAVVVDEYGAMAGIVTIEDVLEEIVGEIVDEYDSEEDKVTELGEGRWRIDARLPVGQLAELVQGTLPDEEWDSVGGLLFGTLGHVPRPGEFVEVDVVRLTAERVRGRRISEVIVEQIDPRDDELEVEALTDADAS